MSHIERLDLQPEVLELLVKIVEQNRIILEQNGALIETLASPPTLVSRDYVHGPDDRGFGPIAR